METKLISMPYFLWLLCLLANLTFSLDLDEDYGDDPPLVHGPYLPKDRSEILYDNLKDENGLEREQQDNHPTWSSCMRYSNLTKRHKLGTMKNDELDYRILNGTTGYISEGRDAREGEFPPFVGLYGKRRGYLLRQICGGTILSRNHILTAAHCYKRDEKVYVIPTYKNSYHDGDISSMFKVKKTCISKGYHGRIGDHDIAVMKLERPLEFSWKVDSALLPSNLLHTQTLAYAIGFGKNNQTNRKKSILQVLPVRKTVCSRSNTDKKYHICFKSADPKHAGDVCQGDSGGPIIAKENNKFTVFGITSEGSGNCRKRHRMVSVYMDTYTEREEILKLVNECS